MVRPSYSEERVCAHADCHNLRFSSACRASRSARDRIGISTSLGSSFAARSACISQSSSSQASGVLVFFPMSSLADDSYTDREVWTA